MHATYLNKQMTTNIRSQCVLLEQYETHIQPEKTYSIVSRTYVKWIKRKIVI